MFVNNERTLLKIYEVLFPHRATPNAGAGVSSQMVAESGQGNYGQNALRALKSRGGYDQNYAGIVTQANDQLLNMLPPVSFNEFDQKG